MNVVSEVTVIRGRPVGVGPRLGAWLIDVLFCIPVAMLLQLAHGDSPLATMTRRDPRTGVVTTSHSFNVMLYGWAAIAFIALLATYYVVMEARFGGTLGKRARGLRVVMADGSPMTWRAAVIRTAWRALDAFPYFLPYLSGAVHVWFTKRKQRMGDRAAHTIIVRRGDQSNPEQVAPTAPPATRPSSTAWELQ